MELLTLKTFDTAIDARIVKNTLEGEGIPAYIFDENIVTLNPLFNFAVGGIRLQVNREDFEKAQLILAEIDEKPLTNDQGEVIACPNCNSANLYSDFKTMKDPKGLLAMITAFFMTAFPIYAKSVYKCKDCGTEFEKQQIS